jgi:hypothetical protein
MARVEGQVTVRDARVIFRNFSGRPDTFNPQGGKRTFCVVLDDETALRLHNDGWNVKRTKGREGDEDGEVIDSVPYVQVTVGYKVKPPRVVMISQKGRTELTEDSVSVLDSVDIVKCDLSFVPYNYDSKVTGSGISAYLKTMFATIELDEERASVDV